MSKAAAVAHNAGVLDQYQTSTAALLAATDPNLLKCGSTAAVVGHVTTVAASDDPHFMTLKIGAHGGKYSSIKRWSSVQIAEHLSYCCCSPRYLLLEQ